MSGIILHYIFDPLCGWCYGAAPLVKAVQNMPNLTLKLHAGGMMSGPNRRQIDSQWRGYVMPHDKRIAELTGQIFGDNYFNRLLNDTSAIMDSTPPIAAILAAEALAGRGVSMLHRIQTAHYIEGRRIADVPILVDIATEIGLDSQTFIENFNAALKTSAEHIAESRALLAKVSGHGFPTFLLQDAQGKLSVLPANHYYGNPSGWKEMLMDTSCTNAC
ncbi:DsbA family protein [Yersinia aldovae]|uniref:DsbA family protein n=1 Tax=Yersinia aldovae TaxID=29483 RepID=UPI00119D4281|nr:DsbA family protein [Yersinia aldovae]